MGKPCQIQVCVLLRALDAVVEEEIMTLIATNATRSAKLAVGFAYYILTKIYIIDKNQDNFAAR